jgi:predicted HTH transcriptional regulator
LHGKNNAYVIWGVEDATHEIVGTKFDHRKAKVKGTEIEMWLRMMLNDFASFRFHAVDIAGKHLELLEIDRAQSAPVRFMHVEYVRIGSYKKKLNDLPAVAADLWRKLNGLRYEELYAKRDIRQSDVFALLDYVAYFDLTGIVQPDAQSKMIHYLIKDGIVEKQDDSLFAITNLGALSLAKRLSDFDTVWRKALRIVQYDGKGRIRGLREEQIEKGYMVGYEDSIRIIKAMLPSREEINGPLRETITEFPDIAIRELVANMAMHQDMTVTGAGPMVEIFEDRIEFTNPGEPLIDAERFIDDPPKSRNEKLAALFRRADLCEERGSGWDKIAAACEEKHLPSPRIDVYGEKANATKVTLFSKRPFRELSLQEKIWSCYMHACLCQVNGAQLTNASLRDRFGLPESSKAMVSRLIANAVGDGLIKKLDSTAAPRFVCYVPYWA